MKNLNSIIPEKLKEITRNGVNSSSIDSILSLDIGTQKVKAILASIDNGKLVIKGIGRVEQGLNDMSSGVITDIPAVIANCNEAITIAEEQSGLVADATIAGIAGELVSGATTRIDYERKNPQKEISYNELKQILKTIQDSSLVKSKDHLHEELGIDNTELDLINSAVVDVYIDGHRVTNPLGFQGAVIGIEVYNGFAPRIHINAISKVVNDLDLKLLDIAAEPFGVAKSIGQDEEQEFSAIFIDVGGGTSDIAIVDSGGVEGTKMFAIGGRSFTKRIADVFNLGFMDAEKTKIKYSEGKLGKNDSKKVENLMIHDVEVWLEGVSVTLNDFSRLDKLPSKIFLCGNGSKLKEIKKGLESEKWANSVGFSRKIKVKYIKVADVKTVEDPDGILESPGDITAMGLLNLGLDNISTATVGDNILARLSRSIRI